ncbi:asparaginyl-tRNA synthetase [Micromonospora carbonacea]|uniref:Asparaginyl-tRNA synthetase n=1 Tax=Micromonospora carbonacea TaxID=47853 RepID=A0A1C5ASH9_9ACTN|nr:asparaginyl-tRNA synthetase [Micromonospora carbonacea]
MLPTDPLTPPLLPAPPAAPPRPAAILHFGPG